jgi:hypothetical protein
MSGSTVTDIDGAVDIISSSTTGLTNVVSVAALKLLGSAITDNDSITVLGYYAEGDGGGGTFYWDATSTETDNGGTVIKATSVTTGRWMRVFSGAVNVKWFGALLDGSVEDVAFTKADTFSNGGVVYVPFTSSGINVSGLTATSTFQFESSFNNSGTSSLLELNGSVIDRATGLELVYKDGLPIKNLSINATFNNDLNSEIFYDGDKVQYRENPFDAIDFTKDGTPFTQYYVNYALGSDAGTGLATGAGAFKTLDYAIANAVLPAEIILEDDIVGYLSSNGNKKTVNGKLKLTGNGNSGSHTLIAGMRESYDLASFAWAASGTGGAYVSGTASAKFYRAQFDASILDEDGIPKPITAAADIATCQATRGTYFWDSGTTFLYVNMYDGRLPDPLDGWQYGESPYDFEIYQSDVTANGVMLIENVNFLSNLGAATLPTFKYRPTVAPAAANASVLGLRNCKAYGSSGNGFSTYDANIQVMDNCIAKYCRIDGFNYHSYNNDATNGEFITVYEHNCKSRYTGYDGFTDQSTRSTSSNGSTSHDSMHIMRTNGDFSDCYGSVVADVNGVHSLNYNVKARLPVQAGEAITFNACFWHDSYINVGTYPTMWLWGCSASDNGDIDVSIISNKPQSGASIDSIYVDNWRGQTDGDVIGNLKDFSGSIV